MWTFFEIGPTYGQNFGENGPSPFEDVLTIHKSLKEISKKMEALSKATKRS